MITAKYTGRIDPYATHVATVLSRRLRHLQGGLALVEFNDHRVCYLALTNTAPYSVTIGRNEFIGELDQWTNVDDPRPLDQDIVTKFINNLETKAQKLVNPAMAPRYYPIKKSTTRPTSMFRTSSRNDTCSSCKSTEK